jgi:hypothetical protein
MYNANLLNRIAEVTRTEKISDIGGPRSKNLRLMNYLWNLSEMHHTKQTPIQDRQVYLSLLSERNLWRSPTLNPCGRDQINSLVNNRGDFEKRKGCDRSGTIPIF